MEREAISVLAHLLTVMKESIENLEKALKKNDNEEIMAAKREILKIQSQIKNTL